MTHVYRLLKQAGCKIDNHASDLYVLATTESSRIIRDSGKKYGIFTSEIDGKRWFEIPFAYLPFWEAKQRGELI